MEPKYNEERYYEAKKRVKEIKGFYGNLTSYIIMSIFFIVINLLTTPKQIWFYWPMLGWGVGVVFHAMKVFNYMPFLGQDWEEQKIKEFMNKEEQQKNSRGN